MKNNKKLTKAELFEKAESGDVSIVTDPRVDKVKNKDGIIPLLFLACAGKAEILINPSVDKVINGFGDTLLHVLSWQGKLEVLTHPSVDKVKNNRGETPLDGLLENRKISRKEFKEMFPWYQLKKNQKVTEKLIQSVFKMKPSDFILNTLD